MRYLVLALGALVLVCAAPLRAEEPSARPWAIETRAAYTLLGGAGRPTGGVAPTLAARRVVWWSAGGGWGLAAGARISAFGFGADAHWLGVLTGPTIATETRPILLPAELGRVVLGLELGSDFGRVPTCNAWGACARFWGWFPTIAVMARYAASERVDAGLLFQARVVTTWAWSGIGWEPAVAGRILW